MSDFSFSLSDLMKGDPTAFATQISKQQNDPKVPLKTTASELGGNESFLSTLSVGQVLMGVNATNSQSDIQQNLDQVLSLITESGLSQIPGAVLTAGKDVFGGLQTAFDYLVPGDIAKGALDWATNALIGGSDAGSGAVPTQVVTIPNAGQITTIALPASAPNNGAFLNQCQKQFGKPYSTDGSKRFGPNYYDCSGFVYSALRAIGIKDPGLPTVSQAMWQWCANDPARKGGGNITVDQAAAIPGALLIRKGLGSNGHVAVSIGDGKNNYAAVGGGQLSGQYPNSGSNFDAGGLVPGILYTALDRIK